MKKVSRRHSKDNQRPRNTSASFVSERFEVRIDRMAFGGSGVGRREDGKVVFVPYSAPGDLLKVRTTADHKSYFEAEIEEIVESSSIRTKAPCPVFGRCGGCSWQHLNYAEQLKQKEQIVRGAFDKLSLSVQKWLPIVACENTLHYRNRIQLQVQDKKVGYFARKSHDFVEIKSCPIAEEPINDYLKNSTKWKDGRIEISLDAELKAQHRSSEDEIGSHDFSQVNRFQNSKLIAAVIDAAGAAKPERILDLYAGSGNFSFPLLDKFKLPLRAVELSSPAVETAHQKILKRALSPKAISFFCGDVEAFLARQKLTPVELVLLDPPRMGCSPGTIRNLASQAIKDCVYISCNPMTLARDLALWKSIQPRLQILSVQPFDMFPQTDHVEVMVALHIDSAH